MLLAIDVGNTNTVFAVYKGEKQINSWRLRSDAARSPDEYAAFLNELFALSKVKWAKIKHVIVSSVVPEANFSIGQFAEKYTGCEAAFVTQNMVGIGVDIDRPEDVGADRLVNAAAVKAHYALPAVVIDFGTATTFDVVNTVGNYAGGVIAPGVNLSVDALHRAASKLPNVSVKKPEAAIGKTTTGAIQAGIYYGYKGLIEGIIREITEEMGGPKPYVIATGGLAPLFAKDSDVIDIVDGDLTLKGLLVLHEQQVKA